MSATRLLFVSTTFAALFLSPSAYAQNNRIWTGNAAPEPLWTTASNWIGGVPGSGDVALFNNLGNGNTTISLNVADQPIGSIKFDDASTPSYTLGTLPGDKLNVDNGGSIVVTQSVTTPQTINADLHLVNATVSNSSTAPLTLGGAISAGGTLTIKDNGMYTSTTIGPITEITGQPLSLSLLATATSDPSAHNSFTLSGPNTYTGPTTIQAQTGSGAIGVSGNSPFGSGVVNVNLVGTAPQLSWDGHDVTIPNTMKLNSGLMFNGTFNLTGPLTILISAVGGSRIFSNVGNGTLTLGATPGSSTITLGGTDGIGKSLVLTTAFNVITLNDVVQDPAAGGGAASGGLQFAGTGITRINSLSTYTGSTLLNGVSTVQFATDYHAGDVSGPFGLGTLTPNGSLNNTLQPIGGDRVLANPVSMLFGLTVGNASGDASGLTLSGPISFSATGRAITNNLTGTLTLGSATSPSSISLTTASGQSVSVLGAGATVINDVIQNSPGSPSPATTMVYSGTGPVTLNSLNTYSGDTSITGLALNVRIGSSSNALPGASFTAGPFGTGTIATNNTTTAPVFQPVGADRTVSNAINMVSGFTASNVAGTPYSLTLAGPIALGATSRIISNNIPIGANLVLGAAAAPSTLTIGSTLTIQSQVAGAGSTIVNDAVTGVGNLTVQGGAVVQLNNSTNDYGGMTLVTGAGSKLIVNGAKTGSGAVTVNASGTLGGSGSVKGAIANSGTIAPGAVAGVPGTLTLNGKVTMAANSHLAIDLNAVADKLVVNGNLDLSNVDYLDLGSPGSGLSWVIASYTGVLTGTFNHITIVYSGFGPFETTSYTVNYGTGNNSQITLTAALTGLKGDFNNNGRVDAADYVLWRNNLGTNNPLLNDNGLGTPIGQSHYNLWRAAFNSGNSGSGAIVSGEVPEPSSLLLVSLAMASAVTACIRRRTATS